MERIEIPVGDLTFDALAAGPDDGALVLLLHGFPQTSWAWRHQLDALAEAGYRAVAPDQRGYSPRARPEGVAAYQGEHLIGDVLAMADWLGANGFHLVGHDWGAAVAWQLAGRQAQRLRTLSILSVPHPIAFAAALRGELGGDQVERSGYISFFQEEGSEQVLLAEDAAGLRALYAGSGLHDAEAVDRYIDALGTPEALGAALNWYRAGDVALIEGLGPITTPTLFVWSTEDIALGREAAEATAEHLDGPYRFEVLDGVSHWISEEVPGRLNALLLDHLAQGGG